MPQIDLSNEELEVVRGALADAEGALSDRPYDTSGIEPHDAQYERRRAQRAVYEGVRAKVAAALKSA